MSTNFLDYQSASSVIKLIVLASAVLSVVFTFGIVWRVEKKLDVSYKFFLAAIIFFTLSEAIILFNVQEDMFFLSFADLSKMLFAVFFLAGILTMRSLIRHIDGEK